jgi:hypothetical protein
VERIQNQEKKTQMAAAAFSFDIVAAISAAKPVAAAPHDYQRGTPGNPRAGCSDKRVRQSAF